MREWHDCNFVRGDVLCGPRRQRNGGDVMCDWSTNSASEVVNRRTATWRPDGAGNDRVYHTRCFELLLDREFWTVVARKRFSVLEWSWPCKVHLKAFVSENKMSGRLMREKSHLRIRRGEIGSRTELQHKCTASQRLRQHYSLLRCGPAPATSSPASHAHDDGTMLTSRPTSWVFTAPSTHRLIRTRVPGSRTARRKISHKSWKTKRRRHSVDVFAENPKHTELWKQHLRASCAPDSHGHVVAATCLADLK